MTHKGANYQTDTVHLARRVRDRITGLVQLVQQCGMSRHQYAYLYEVDSETPVTCKRCLAKQSSKGN